MKLKSKMILSFLSVMLVFFIMIVSIILYLIQTEKTIDSIVNSKFEIDKEIRNAEVVIANIHSDIWDTLLFNIDSRDMAINDLNNKARNFYKTVNRLEDIGERDKFLQLREIFRSYYQFASTFLDIENIEDLVKKEQSVEKFKSNKEKLINILDIIVDTTRSDFEDSLYNLENDFSRARILLFVAVIISSIIATILISILTGILVRPILALTESANNIKAGNMNIITKTKSNDEIGILTDAFNRMISNIKHYQENLEDNVNSRTIQLRKAMNDLENSNKELTKTRDALWGEMQLAKKIQTILLPDNIEHPDLDISAQMLTAQEVGGDYYDFAYDKEGNFWISIGDVSGHGVTPGLIMMMAQTAHYTSLCEQESPTPKSVISSVNRLLFSNITGRLKSTNFMTMTSIKYKGNGNYIYSGAHLDILIFRKTLKKVEVVETIGTFLNITKDINHALDERSFHLNSGDTMILYSDGIIEAKNSNGELLDVNGLSSLIKKYSHLNVEGLNSEIINNTMKWCNNIFNDDISLLIIRQR